MFEPLNEVGKGRFGSLDRQLLASILLQVWTFKEGRRLIDAILDVIFRKLAASRKKVGRFFTLCLGLYLVTCAFLGDWIPFETDPRRLSSIWRGLL